MSALVSIALGVGLVLVLTALTGYFVAQEFAYLAVDRSRLTAQASAGDASSARALRVTTRTSFMLSGAQLGITVTGLLVGYLAEPLIGESLGALLEGVGIAPSTGVALGIAVALLFATLVQMVFGELLPKNLAIARPDGTARWLARSTTAYLALFGWLIRLFDQACTLLLKALRIEPVHDVEHAATARDLEHILVESRQSGQLPAELSVLLERVLDFQRRTVEHAMTPRTSVRTVSADEPISGALEILISGPSRLPVLGRDADDVVGVLALRDVLALDDHDLAALTARDVARPAVLVPSSLPLDAVLDRLGAEGVELACVLDEYGGLAGVVTAEDLAEELVGEITDEHDPERAAVLHRGDSGGWLVDATMPLDEAQRLVGRRLPDGDYQTVAGLVIAELGRLPEVGDTVALTLTAPAGSEEPDVRLSARVHRLGRHVPAEVHLSLTEQVAHR
ncbi:hemolysin family protein [Pseudonocardia spinosispora]|uniref:hemolysin family protein n=1 Tax=Pseudonocardia spinosispora TaxID=103441 RepID=UPI00040157A2|nr:hemolysin family protein [Pseudonocardia spinosispora]